MCTLVRWLVRIELRFGYIGQIVALYWPQNDKIAVSDHYLKKNIRAFLFKLGVYTCWESFSIDSFLGHIGQILAFKWPQNNWKWWFLTNIWKSTIMWSNDYSIYFTQSTWCSHWIEGSPQWGHLGLIQPLWWPFLNFNCLWLDLGRGRALFDALLSNILTYLLVQQLHLHESESSPVPHHHIDITPWRNYHRIDITPWRNSENKASDIQSYTQIYRR